MALRTDFPSKDLLEKEGYETEADISEATDEELLAIKGIAEGSLAKIREVAPYLPSSDETGAGATSGKSETSSDSESLGLTSQSYQAQTSKAAKNQTDPVTGQDLPKGIVKNERGTLTASSTVDQTDMVHPDKLAKERRSRLRSMGEKISAALEE